MAKQTILEERGTGEVLYPQTLASLVKTADGGNVDEGLEKAKLALFDDMWIQAGFINGVHYSSIDRENHPDEPYILNDVPNSYEEAIYIYQISAGYVADVTDPVTFLRTFQYTKCKTFFPAIIGGSYMNFRQLYTNCEAEVIRVCGGNDVILKGDAYAAFQGCKKLRKILPILSYFIDSLNTFRDCPELEYVLINIYSATLNLQHSPKLNYESVNWLVNHKLFQGATTVTVHPDVYAKLTGDTTNAAAAALTPDELAAWQQVLTDAAAKNITFATT